MIIKKLSIIIPVFNEEKTIEETINRVFNQTLNNWQKEIIVVDDGSTDRTRKILNSLKIKFSFVLMCHEKNSGKGAAIKTALNKVSGEYVIIQDADLEYSPTDWPQLLKNLDDPKVQIIFGSRELHPQRRGYAMCIWGVRFLTALTNICFGSNLTDIYTCYKIIPSQTLKSFRLKSPGFEIEAEITSKALRNGMVISEAPINYCPRSFKNGKKIRFHDGLSGAWTIIKVCFFKFY